MCKISIGDSGPICDHNQTGTHNLHLVTFIDHHCRILAKSKSHHSGVAGNCLDQPAKPPTLSKMSINEDAVNKIQPVGKLQLSFYHRVLAASSNDHGIRHCGSACACTCNYKIGLI